ncbi:MAG: DUF167 domain-containing protein [Deltaproteobacteria bacterium]|nr:DUF167 domain-containing protein [Deltaproteobacteria bacterium]
MALPTAPERPAWLGGQDGAVQIRVHAQPGARKTRAVGEHGGRLKVALHAPPVDGKANAELLRWLAQTCGLPNNRAALLHGATARDKVVILRADLATVTAAVQAALAAAA